MGVKLTGREAEIMAVLWDAGSATVADVREQLPDDLAYTTVLSLIRTMESKGYVRHVGEGRAHRYFPRIQEQAIRRSAVKEIISTVFRGTPELLAAQLVSDRHLGAAELSRLRALIDERLPERDR